MQSNSTRLARAKRDLAKAEAKLAEISTWQPGTFTSESEIRQASIAQADRVRRLRIRVGIREEAVAREAART